MKRRQKKNGGARKGSRKAKGVAQAEEPLKLRVVAEPESDEPETAEADERMRAEAFQQVGKEVLNQDLDPATWAEALSECRGTHEDAIALYARIRSENISKKKHFQHLKVRELESRRRGSFRDYKDVPKLARCDPEATGIPGLIDSVFWHVLACVGVTGSILAARILWPASFANVTNANMVTVIFAMQLIPILAWWAGCGRRGALSYPGMAQLTACVALLGSVTLGVELFKSGDRLIAEQNLKLMPQMRPAQPPLNHLAATPGEEDSEQGDLIALSGSKRAR